MQFGSRFLFPLMVIAAISVIAFGGIGIAVLTGHLPLFGAKQAQFDKAQAPNVVVAMSPLADPELLVAARSMDIVKTQEDRHATCKDCGVVESVESSTHKDGPKGGPLVIKATESSAPKDIEGALGFLIRVRMDDGGLRIIEEARHPNVQMGQRVRVINGVVQPQS